MDGEGVGIVGEPPTPLAPLLLREHEHEVSQRRGGGRRRPARWIGGGEGSREGGVEWSCVKERVSKSCGGRCGGWTRKRRSVLVSLPRPFQRAQRPIFCVMHSFRSYFLDSRRSDGDVGWRLGGGSLFPPRM